MSIDAGWQWPVWLPDGGGGRCGQGWITSEQGTRSAPEENKSATVITQGNQGRTETVSLLQSTPFLQFVLV